uniref:PB1-like domain-containing protein n=1 Tax=Oryza rufipogon TaxID=4529 RepID=A0A0E0N0A6_ORYRU
MARNNVFEGVMDNLDVLCIRFHFGGEFDYDGYSVVYNGGQTEMSYIERDKVALPEIRGYLGDHVSLSEEDEVIFHWLFPGAELNNGLKALSDDKECLYMAQCIIMGDVAEIYAEILKHNEDDNVVLSNGVSDDSDVEDDIEEEYDSHSDAEDSSETDGIAEDDEERSEDDEEAQENREHANKVQECSRPQKRFRPSVAAGTSQQKVHIDLPSQSSSLSITKKGQTMKVARTNTTKK